MHRSWRILQTEAPFLLFINILGGLGGEPPSLGSALFRFKKSTSQKRLSLDAKSQQKGGPISEAAPKSQNFRLFNFSNQIRQGFADFWQSVQPIAFGRTIA